MDVVSSLPALAALCIAFVVAFFLAKIFGAPDQQGRFASIDGLRGYLALFVFFHHACIWYFFLRSDDWTIPPSNLYTHFGQSSVVMFFMITAFLFFSKLLDARAKPIDWLRLFVSRLLRLVPLYLFAMVAMFGIVAILSGGVLNDSIAHLALGAIRWLSFTILGTPDLNHIEGTYLIVASVTWSLPYEWFFYLALPLLALAARVRVGIFYIVASVICLVLMLLVWQPQWLYLAAFGAGMIAAIIARSSRFQTLASTHTSSAAIVACLVAIVVLFPTIEGIAPMLLLTLVFILIACGNSLFGILTHPVSRTLGEMSYSIYLLHGIALFILFRFVIGLEQAESLSPTMHWAYIVGLTPILLVLCFFTFMLIERPAMRSTVGLASWLRRGCK
ncbi:acyltransferase [Pseudolysobacter antarcticus]|uniref:Acyltransferase n=1 Tax=Pseudolysobacter antarcticus TaxID=2511995 RepID=A0A411HMA7_9GAMM|nr:acyltransferase [Pseudolysobacter antarcticus]QBB71497.1 acyltransferase [Pseudolysobacter antarcticus]